MRIINEGIASVANGEDDCTGRFWEGRFSSLALLDEKAIADSLTNSDHTSIKRRCEQAAKAEQPNELLQQASGLHPFADNPRSDMPNGLPFRLTDYLELVDWTGRILRDDKRGAISESTPKILQQLSVDPKHWCYLSQNCKSQFKSLVVRHIR
jgi:hypothetical protein